MTTLELMSSLILYHVTLDSPPNVTAFCSRSLGDDHKFSVLIQLIIDSYIAEESLLQRIEIIPKLMKKDHVQNIFALIEKPVIVCVL